MEGFSIEQPITSSGTRMPQSPRRPTHQLPPRLNIHPTASSDLGPPAQVQVFNSNQYKDISLSFFLFIARHTSAFKLLFSVNIP